MMLHIGNGGVYLDGWINIDLHQTYKSDIYGDILTMDFSDISMIYASHFFEHLQITDAVKCLDHFYKWMNKGAILRLAVPSLELAAQAYVNGSDLKFLYGADFKGYYLHDTSCERFNFFMKEWEHKLTYDFNQLRLMLSNAGFTNIERKQANQSIIPGFNHDRFISESLYVESIK